MGKAPQATGPRRRDSGAATGSPGPDTADWAWHTTETAAKKVVLFGGVLATGGTAGDTWTWEGTAKRWTNQSPGTTPGARGYAAMASDDRGNVLLFGGGDGTITGFSADTWVWNGVTRDWSPVVAAGPSVRLGASMAYDAARQRTYLFGGLGQVAPCVPTLCHGHFLTQPNQWQGDTWTYGTVV